MHASSIRRDLVSLGLALLLGGGGAAEAERIEVTARPVPLNPADVKQHRVGRLIYRGGLALTSPNGRFGGLSALRLSEEGARITFISDEGSWVTACLTHDPQGNLVGLSDAELGPLLGLDGNPLVEKDAADAESLALMPDGSMVVGFEHQHRLWRYPVTGGRPDGTPTVVPPPPGIEKAPPNGGIEALVAWGQDGLFALTEYWVVNDLIRGFTNGPDHWETLGYRFEAAYRPSDMARLPSGDLIVLERSYNPERGIVSIRLRRVARKAVKSGARIGSKPVAVIEAPLTVDNFEGVDSVRAKGGETLVYVVSDDNFQPGVQRTLLLEFSLDKP